ncbi:MAG: hypothetical protein JWM57_1257 [Phycisphaerales bacterium]|nr:hypothetical protein [Phycisphaerales bacterium]
MISKPPKSTIQKLIDMSPVSSIPQPTAVFSPVQPPANQIPVITKKLTKASLHGIKNTKQDKLYYALLKKHFDMCDFAWRHDKQKSNHIIAKHLNAGADWRNRLPKIKLREIAERRHFGRELFMKPIRTATDKTIAVRFDADAKHGETDAKALVNWIATKLPGLYDEPSKSGHSGWAFFDLTPMTFRDGTINYERRERTNKAIDLLQAALRLLAADAGFASDIETKGRFSTPVIDDEGTRRMPDGNRGDQIKMPKCGKEGSVQCWAASRFSISAAYAIVHEARDLLGRPHNIDLSNSKLAMSAQLVLDSKAMLFANVTPNYSSAPTIAVAKAKLTKIRKRKQTKLKAVAKKVVEDTGDKHHNLNLCASRAIRSMLGTKYDPTTVKEEQVQDLVDIADAIYASSGLAKGERDQDREMHFVTIIKWMIRTHSVKLASKSKDGELPEGWFDLEVDAPAADKLIRSKLSKKALEDLNIRYHSKFDGSKLTYYVLAIALITYTKNALTSDGDVPVTAIMGMCRHFGIRCPGGMAKVVRETLSKLGLIEGNRTWGSGQCESFKIKAKALFLPFVMKMTVAERLRQAYQAEVQEASERAGSGVAKDGAGPRTNLEQITSFPKCIMNTAVLAVSNGLMPEQCRTAILAIINPIPPPNLRIPASSRPICREDTPYLLGNTG